MAKLLRPGDDGYNEALGKLILELYRMHPEEMEPIMQGFRDMAEKLNELVKEIFPKLDNGIQD